jgi:hypothetical protein
MKRFTLVFSLLMTIITAAIAQESIDFSNGTFDGQWGDKETRSMWTSANGLQIVSTDADGNEVGTMKYYNNKFTLYVNEGVATPIKYTITIPEGYSLVEMKVKNSTKSHNAHIDYNLGSISLHNTTAEKTIQFVEGENAFYLYGEVGRTIYLTSLSITNTTGINEVKGESGKAKVIYDLTGRRINEITKPGIYIVDGKKVSVK